jgi:hypothetical protein
MRELAKVIDEILPHIPKEHEELISHLKSYKESSLYAPPEGQGMWWRHAALSLCEVIPEPKEPWEIKVAEIFNGPARTN